MAKNGTQMPDGPVDSIKHPAVVDARRHTASGGPSFLVDGHRLVSQLIGSRAEVERLFLLHPVPEGSPQAVLGERAAGMGIECLTVTRGVFFRILNLGYETAVRVLGLASRPNWANPEDYLGPDTCFLVGENIQDPRNVGVLIRTADAYDLPCVIFTADSADPYSRAAVRSSTGSIFRVPVARAPNLPEDLLELKLKSVVHSEAEELLIVGTSARAELALWQANLQGARAIVLGNETRGLSEEVRRVSDCLVSIPMAGGASSFNVTVAAGILLYERARGRFFDDDLRPRTSPV